VEREYERKIDVLDSIVRGENGSVLRRLQQLETDSRNSTCPVGKELARYMKSNLRSEDMKWLKWGFFINAGIMVTGFVGILILIV
jgi:hypothetical protein